MLPEPSPSGKASKNLHQINPGRTKKKTPSDDLDDNVRHEWLASRISFSLFGRTCHPKHAVPASVACSRATLFTCVRAEAMLSPNHIFTPDSREVAPAVLHYRMRGRAKCLNRDEFPGPALSCIRRGGFGLHPLFSLNKPFCLVLNSLCFTRPNHGKTGK